MFSHAVVCASSGAGDVELLASVACDLVDGVSAQAKLCVCDCSIGIFTFRFALFFFLFFFGLIECRLYGLFGGRCFLF